MAAPAPSSSSTQPQPEVVTVILYITDKDGNPLQEEFQFEKSVAKFSNYLANAIESKSYDEAEFNKTGKYKFPVTDVIHSTDQLRFLTVVLNTLEIRRSNPMSNQEIIDTINDTTGHFTTLTLSFGEVFSIIDYFDIPIVMDAIARYRLPLPTTPDQEAVRDSGLTTVYNIAKGATVFEGGTPSEKIRLNDANRPLWQLVGRMLYPRCTAHKEIGDVVTFLEAHPDIERVVLGAYMQLHPELYIRNVRNFGEGGREISISCDGKYLFSYGHNVMSWDINAGTLKTLAIQGYCYSVSPDGKIFVEAEKGCSYLCDIEGEHLREIENANDSSRFAFTSDSKFFAVVSMLVTNDQYCVRMYDVKTGELLKTFSQKCNANFCPSVNTSFSPNDKIIAIPTDGDVDLWDANNGTLLRTIRSENFAFSPDNKIILARTAHEMNLIEIETGNLLRSFSIAYQCTEVTFSPDGQLIAFSGAILDINTGNLLRLDSPYASCEVRFSPNGQFVVFSLHNIIFVCGYTSLR